MFVTKKGSNLRRPAVKLRRNVVLPQAKKENGGGNDEYFNEDDIDCRFNGMKDSCKKKLKEASKKGNKKEATE